MNPEGVLLRNSTKLGAGCRECLRCAVTSAVFLTTYRSNIVDRTAPAMLVLGHSKISRNYPGSAGSHLPFAASCQC